MRKGRHFVHFTICYLSTLGPSEEPRCSRPQVSLGEWSVRHYSQSGLYSFNGNKYRVYPSRPLTAFNSYTFYKGGIDENIHFFLLSVHAVTPSMWPDPGSILWALEPGQTHRTAGPWSLAIPLILTFITILKSYRSWQWAIHSEPTAEPERRVRIWNKESTTTTNLKCNIIYTYSSHHDW